MFSQKGKWKKRLFFGPFEQTLSFKYHISMMHLHTRSMYSLLESPLRPAQIVENARQAGMSTAVITDHDTMAGFMAFGQAARQAGMHAAYGLETTLHDLNAVILAKDDEGLLELYAGQYSSAHCVIIFTGIRDRLEEVTRNQDETGLQEIIATLKASWDSFYIAEAMMDVALRKDRQPWLQTHLDQAGIPVCALSYVLYEKEEDSQQLRMLQAIRQGTAADDLRLDVPLHRQFRSAEEMRRLYSPAAIANTEAIEASLQADFGYPRAGLPPFHNRLNISSRDFLVRLAKAGLEKRLAGHVPQTYRNRLDYELSVINSMGFTDYFLIVYDMIRYARSQDILVGPGRGSAAGSLVAYSLGITCLDPVASGLLFERFLNPERVTMPDIDTDFPDDRRDEIVAYLKETYGQDHCVQIAAFSNLKARQVLRDVGKACSLPGWQIDAVTRLIPQMPGMTLQKAWDTVPSFRKKIESRTDLKRVYSMACKLEGLPRHVTQHAAGVVLSDRPIIRSTPVFHLDDETTVTQYTMEYLESLGLIKIDVLALRNLSIIKSILDMIWQREGRKIDIYNLPEHDRPTYELLGRGDTLGVFQLEKEGIRKLLRDMLPDSFEDVAIVLALYRPGPMQEIPRYLYNRAHPDKIRYPHPLLEPVLRETYGVMIYQEQIMEAARIIGGFSLAQADILRKAMSKKNKDVMDQWQVQFVNGAEKQGIPQEEAAALFALMEKFAGYGFNKSHSYAYGKIAYGMAWLKARYPLYFYKALLDGVIGSEVKTGQYLYECRQRHVTVLGPDIRVSADQYEIEENGLRMPLTVLKGIGKSVIPRIRDIQKQSPFTTPVAAISALWAAKVSESQIHTLINGGALDFFGCSRATLNENVVHILNYANVVRVDRDGQLFDFSIVHEPTLIKVKENPVKKATLEKEALGFYLSEHPIAALRPRYPRARKIQDIQDVNGYVSVIGRVSDLHTHKTRKGDLMAFVTFEDESGQIDLAVMPDLFLRQRELIVQGSLLAVQGKKDRPGSVLVQSMQEIKTELE